VPFTCSIAVQLVGGLLGGVSMEGWKRYASSLALKIRDCGGEAQGGGKATGYRCFTQGQRRSESPAQQ
jgi:hypothetical protein